MDTTKGVNIKNVLYSVLSESISPECLAKLVSVVTDAASGILREHSGVIAIILKVIDIQNFYLFIVLSIVNT